VSILNSPEISQAYFFPQDVPCNDAIEVDVGDAILRCHHHVGNDDGRTLVHFHGNGEAVGHYTQDGFIPTLSARLNQINVLMIEYRGYGGSSEVEMVSMLPDGQQVLEQLNIDPAKTIAYGRSIGSLYALELANRCPTLAGLVIDSGVADIKERFLARKDIAEQIQDWDEVNKQVELHFNHQAKIESYDGKVVLLHAARDGLINLTHAIAFTNGRRMLKFESTHFSCRATTIRFFQSMKIQSCCTLTIWSGIFLAIRAATKI
jgi:pimeloyl-ACP methyl ester carboxylesterase